MARTDTIAVRFAVQDADKVKAALDALGKDGQKLARDFDKAMRAGAQGPTLMNGAVVTLGRAMTDLSTGGVSMLGTAFRSLLGQVATLAGPAGFALIVRELLNFSNSITTAATATGLTITHLQGVAAASRDFGVNFEQATTGLRQFAVQSQRAGEAQGDLFDALMKVNPEIARAFSMAETQAERLKIITQAYDGIASASQRAALANAAFGEQGGRILQGLSAYQKNPAGFSDRVLDEDLIKRADEVSKKIGVVFDTIRAGIMSSISPVVDKLMEFIKYSQDTIKHGATTPDLTYGDLLTEIIGGTKEQEARVKEKRAREERRAEITRFMEDSAKELDGLIRQQQQARERQFASKTADDFKAANAEMARLEARAADLKAKRREMSDERDGLGRPPEKKFQVFEEPHTVQTRDQMQAAASERSLKALLNEERVLKDRAAVLGELTPATDKLRMAEIQLEIALSRKVNLSERDVAMIREQISLSVERERVASRTALGVATAEERMAVKQRELAVEVARGRITQDDATKALNTYRNELDSTIRSEINRASNFPALSKIATDADNLRKSVDDLAAGSLNSMADGLVQVAQGAKSAGDAFRDMGTQILSGVLKILLMRNVVAPLANMLQGALGGMFGIASFDFADGGIMSGAGRVQIRGYAAGGIARTPQLAQFGEASIPEAYVPVPSGRIPVSLDMKGAAGANVQVNIVTPPGTTADVKRSQTGGGQQLDVVVRALEDRMEGRMIDSATSGKMATALERTFGLNRARGNG